MTQAIERVNGLRSLSTLELGDIMVKSGFFSDTKDQAQAIVKILYGAELGFGPIASMLGCYIVNGRPSLSAQLIASAIIKSGRYRYRVRETTDTACRIEFFDKNESVGESVFTRADAENAQLWGKAIWKQYPKAMLWARAMSQGARMYTPDVFNGAIYTPEELGELPDDNPEPIATLDVLMAPEPEPERQSQTDVEEKTITRGDDPLWQRYLALCVEAGEVDVVPDMLTLPVHRDSLVAVGKALAAEIAEARDKEPAF